jgi:hypothetical protein
MLSVRMHLKSTALGIGGVALLIGVVILAWQLNAMLGYRKGEIDQGRWYVMKSSSGHGTYLEKGIDPGNQFLEADRALARFEKLPNYVETLQGYGAVFIDIGWLGDAYLSSSDWHLFSSEVEAVEFLKANGVANERILYLYK